MKQGEVCDIPLQKVALESVGGQGLIIDIGGGGEGLVSRLEGGRVCAVDININKIREARIYPQVASWFACDAMALCFTEETFDVATIWFSLAYMRTWEAKRKVLAEVYRVLKGRARLSIKACLINCEESQVSIPVDFIFPDGSTSRFGFRVAGRQDQTPERLVRVLSDTGFSVERLSMNGYTFSIEGRKP